MQEGKVAHEGDTVHVHLLENLAAIATSSARLHLRKHVLPFPDGALAIKLVEESLQVQVD